jgi:hypothetical protein
MIDDRPAHLSTPQALRRHFRKFATAQTAAKQDGQDRSIALSGESLSIGYLPERRLISQPSDGRHSHINRSGRQAPFLQVEPTPQNLSFIEGQLRFRKLPSDELIDSVLVYAPRVGRNKAPEGCGFRALLVRYTELGLWSALLALCLIH